MARVAALLVLLCLILFDLCAVRADVVVRRYVPPEKYSESIVLAAEKGNLEAVRQALRHDPDVAQWRHIKGTALCEAARAGHIEVVRFLLEHQASVDSPRSPYQYTPLHCAVSNGSPEIVRLVLEHKPPLEARERDGETPLMMAARSCNLTILKLLLDAGAQLETKGTHDHTALCFAVHAYKPECVRELVQRGANTAVVAFGIGQSGSFSTPLIAAVDSGGTEVVQSLLDGGADPNLNQGGRTALFAAAERKTSEILNLLLAAKADPNRIDDQGMTPIAVAAEFGTPEIVESLLAAKADMTVADKEGRTPLLRAALRHNKGAAMALLAAGADPLIVSKDRERAIDFLIEDMNKDAPELRAGLAKYLNKKGLPIKPLPPMPRGAGKSGDRCIEHADCNWKEQLGCTPSSDAKKPFTGICQPMPADKRKLRSK